MAHKYRHLELIQDIVNRMAHHSFVLKGWSLTLVVAVFVLTAKEALDTRFLAAAGIPVAIFWFLDGYYLQRERLFRALYDEVRIGPSEESDFSMEVKHLSHDRLTLRSVLFSRTITIFYLALLAMIVTMTYLKG